MQIEMISTVGKRKNNQDSLLVNDKIYSQEQMLFSAFNVNPQKAQLFAVADGMGGEKFGDIASEKVVSILKEELTPIIEAKKNTDILTKAIVSAINKAQEEIEALLEESNSIGGTTISVLLLCNGSFVSVNIGDSPIYLIRKNKSLKLSKTHTLAEKLLAEGAAKSDVSESDYHCLLQCVGSGGYSEIAVTEGQYCAGDILAVMSDGMALWGENKMKKILTQKSIIKHMKKFQKADDNVSGIIIRL